MERAITLTQCIHLTDSRPEVPFYVLIALRQKVYVIEYTIAPVVLYLHKPGALCLDAHIDIFGYQTDKLLGVFRL